MGQVMNWMGWISLLICFAIMGMGGAPIAERFGPEWLVTVLTGIAYISISLLAVATLLIGGLFLYHGFLTLSGRSPGTIIEEARERLAAQPVMKPKVVDEPQS